MGIGDYVDSIEEVDTVVIVINDSEYLILI
jgi:hypothetical protein